MEENKIYTQEEANKMFEEKQKELKNLYPNDVPITTSKNTKNYPKLTIEEIEEESRKHQIKMARQMYKEREEEERVENLPSTKRKRYWYRFATKAVFPVIMYAVIMGGQYNIDVTVSDYLRYSLSFPLWLVQAIFCLIAIHIFGVLFQFYFVVSLGQTRKQLWNNRFYLGWFLAIADYIKNGPAPNKQPSGKYGNIKTALEFRENRMGTMGTAKGATEYAETLWVDGLISGGQGKNTQTSLDFINNRLGTMGTAKGYDWLRSGAPNK